MSRAALAFFVLLLAGCAAASGYDPRRYEGADAGAPDPETAPIAVAGATGTAPKTTIPDPKRPPPPAPPSSPGPAPTAPPASN